MLASFHSHASTYKAQALAHSISPTRFTFGSEYKLAFSLKAFPKLDKLDFNVGHLEIKRCSKLQIKAVTTLEPWVLPRSETEDKKGYNGLKNTTDQTSLMNHIQVASGATMEKVKRVRISSGESTEKLRRMRISKANKGNTPWNKGRKHSAETIQRIKERTRLAMQDPKVKMKIIQSAGHSQSKETRAKIGIAVQVGWDKRREKRMMQETCRFQWENLIADVSRIGYVGENELQWDSYKVLDEQLEKKWLETIQHRKIMSRPQGSRSTSKPPDQRRKISQAISTKWADPGYRNRVTSAMAKYHGVPVGAERKPRRRANEDAETKTSHAAQNFSDMFPSGGQQSSTQLPRLRPKRTSAPLFEDPLANSNLEMIKNIRAKRVVAGTKKVEAIERARLLIAQAEKAAMTLEVAAKTSPLAQASLMETRSLIAEAIKSMESINGEEILSDQNNNHPRSAATGQVNHVEQLGVNGAIESKLNGNHAITLKYSKNGDSGRFNHQNLHHSYPDIKLFPTSANGSSLPSPDLDNSGKQFFQVCENNGNIQLNGHKYVNTEVEKPSNTNIRSKKWVRGKLVEITEE